MSSSNVHKVACLTHAHGLTFANPLSPLQSAPTRTARVSNFLPPTPSCPDATTAASRTRHSSDRPSTRHISNLQHPTPSLPSSTPSWASTTHAPSSSAVHARQRIPVSDTVPATHVSAAVRGDEHASRSTLHASLRPPTASVDVPITTSAGTGSSSGAAAHARGHTRIGPLHHWMEARHARTDSKRNRPHDHILIGNGGRA